MSNSTFSAASPNSLEKYQQGIGNRILPQQIIPENDYLLNAVLRPQPDCEAFTVPLRITNYPEKIHRAGVWVVHSTLLDPDMKPEPTSFNGPLGLFHLKENGMLALTDELHASAPGITAGYLNNYA